MTAVRSSHSTSSKGSWPERKPVGSSLGAGAQTSVGGEKEVKKKHNILGHPNILPQSIDVEKGFPMRIPDPRGALFGVPIGPAGSSWARMAWGRLNPGAELYCLCKVLIL